MTIKQQLLDRLVQRTARVGIVGLGYVGLPLAVEFAEAGFTVIGVDVAREKVDSLNRGESYILDIPTERLKPLVESGKFCATTDYAALADADTVSICVPTPVNRAKEPDMTFVIDSVDAIAKICHDGMLVVLESTAYPGAAAEIILPRLSFNGFRVGENVFVAFSPERIDPANPRFNVRNTPKVIGGVTPACTEVCSALYDAAVDQIVPVSSPTTAEMVKLLENTFRAVNIGLVNELAIMCDLLGVNVWEVIQAAATKPFGFMPFYPGPGVGGHCIPVDPLYLSWKMKTLNYNARFIELAASINMGMPGVVVERITEALNDDAKPVRGSRIVVLGAAYKRDVDDVRESPALEVLHLLRHKGADVVYHDPYVRELRLEDGAVMQSVAYSEALLEGADCVVIVTDHRRIDYQHVVDHTRLVVDTRNVTAALKGRARVARL
ncbi:MAG: nucleotide sugar dehydrogenase [Anaerolineae bacterium]|nr:nucleotide sugar dehydrogenase [Anaerolineae bacterium]